MKKLRRSDLECPPVVSDCFKLLKKFGTCELHDARHFRIHYEDNKIRVLGYLEDNTDFIDLITVEMKVRDAHLVNISKARNIDPEFGMPRYFENVDIRNTLVLQYRIRNDETRVMYFCHYVRYGRWINHIKNLANYAEKIDEMYEKLNGEDIDDSSLFPDLPDLLDHVK